MLYSKPKKETTGPKVYVPEDKELLIKILDRIIDEEEEK